MSSTFYIDGWNKTKIAETKVYAHEEYPNLESIYFEDDPCYKKDDKGFYRIQEEYSYPDIHMNFSNREAVLSVLGYTDDCVGSIKNEELQAIRKKLMSFINSETKINSVEVPAYSDGNWHFGGVRSEHILNLSKQLLEMVMIAIRDKKYIYWG